MAAQPSNTPSIVQNPYNLELLPVINLNSNATLVEPLNTMDCGRANLDFFPECMVDFESLRVNGKDVAHLFMDQQWKNYFDMLSGFVYFDIVRNFWAKAYVYDEVDAKEEVKKLVQADKFLKGKSRVQLGLRPFNGTEIRSNLLGLGVVITQAHIAKMLGLDIVSDYKAGSMYEEAIKQDLHLPSTSKSEFGKATSLKPEFLVAFRIMLAAIFTRSGGTYTISWPHKHFIFFMLKKA
ncbi:hypothetical protein QL285_075721 [Trifolium repens]|nr:hypothetical protein QL285_075721 [Trifolium repens]